MKNMFPSTLFISADTTALTDSINTLCLSLGHDSIINNPDILIINDEYTIEEIRSIRHFFSQKSYNHQNKIVIIYAMDNLKLEAQNALLKTLEEPGDNNYLILTTDKLGSILNTITSRCHIIKLNKIINEIKSKLISPQDKLDLIKIEKDKIFSFLNEQLQLHHKLLITSPNTINLKNISTLLKSIDMINHNVDPQLALDYFLLN